MRRVIAIVAVLVIAVVLVVVLAGGSGDQGYQVRAVFRNAFSIIPGEDVKIAGVKVGKIGTMDTTAGGHGAAVVLNITKPGFQDFRKDASCTIRPQSLIGEKFVECTPTQLHPINSNPSPALDKLDSGPGKGQYLLPITNTVTPVDLDLVGNILRLPLRQRLTVLLNEFGIGLGARGKELNTSIRAANPALAELDKVLVLLAKQNTTLAKLATDSDASLAPLAKVRKQFADYFTQNNTVNEAQASRSAAFEKNLQLLPSFLRELTPTMQQLQGFSNAFIPVLDNLNAAAPSLNTLTKNIAPFSRASTPSLKTLGTASDAGTAAVVAGLPVSKDLKVFGNVAKPVASDLSELLTSLKTTGGIDKLMDAIYYGTAAINGYDTFGHYLRAELLVNLCTSYAIDQDAKCNGNFSDSVAIPPSRRRAIPADPQPTNRPVSDATGSPSTAGSQADRAALKLPSSLLPNTTSRADPKQTDPKKAVPAPAAGADKAAADKAAPTDPSASLLNYLLGDG